MASMENKSLHAGTEAPKIQALSDQSSESQYKPETRWQRIQEVLWDGGNRTPEERRIVQRLDLHIMSWATFGYFIRLLDSGNISESVNAWKDMLRAYAVQQMLMYQG
jgi:MFS transporter, ACS family, pantothenate transporter